MRLTRHALILVLLLGVVRPGIAGPVLAAAQTELDSVPAGGDGCAGGIALDDGTLETGYGWVPSVLDGRYVQEFPARMFPDGRIDRVCICWTRTESDDRIEVDLHLYRDIGGHPALEPSATAHATVGEVPLFPDGDFAAADVSAHHWQVPSDPFYVGVAWNPSVDRFFFVCADQTPTTPEVDGWFIDDRSDEWGSVLETNDPSFTNHRAMMIRATGRGENVQAIPTLGWTGALVLTLLMASAGLLRLRR